jgi:hypothetical protein
MAHQVFDQPKDVATAGLIEWRFLPIRSALSYPSMSSFAIDHRRRGVSWGPLFYCAGRSRRTLAGIPECTPLAAWFENRSETLFHILHLSRKRGTLAFAF